MAVVFAAHDVRHNRKVAVKVLRPELAATLGVDRFLKEVLVTAGFTHPHILGVIDSGTAGGLPFYVMPFVDGETLRARLDRTGQLPIDEAIRIATAVGSALAYAHDRGVVHRDIKPENVLLQGAHAFVADFGIAIAVAESGGDRLTRTGVRVGTPQYMSPEQISGERQVDGRSDIYALGCITHEMLAGDAPFTGATAQAVMSAVMTEEPSPLAALRRTVPDHLSAAVAVALAKAPADRFGSADEFVQALSQPTPRTARMMAARVPAPAQRRSRMLLMGGGAVAGAALTAFALAVGNRSGQLPFGDATPSVTRHLNIVLPGGLPVALTGPGPLGIWQSALALDPTGTQLAYVTEQGTTTALAVREVSSDSVRVIAGTDGAYHPFFSPDGQWIGFFAGNELKKVLVAGGTPVLLSAVERPVGATWPTGDRILLFQQDGFQLRWVSATAGGRDSIITLSSQFGTPHVLPGGEWAVGRMSSGQLGLLSLADGEQWAITRRGILSPDSMSVRDLLLGASPTYVPTSKHLVFAAEDGGLFALPFDGLSRKVLGEPVLVVPNVRIEEGIGFAEYALAADGTLIYVPGTSQLYGHVAYVGEGGRLDTLPFPRAQYTQPRVSPTGSRIAVQELKPIGGWDVVVLDVRTGIRQRVPLPDNLRAFPAAWFPDGERLLIGAWHPIRFLIRRMLQYDMRTGVIEDLGETDGSYITVAPNGRDFAASDWRTGALFQRALRGDTARQMIAGRGYAADYSPDGRWLTWGSVTGGVDLIAIPPVGIPTPIVERGQQPLWKPDGRAVIYRDGKRFFEVSVTTSPGGVQVGTPRLLADGPFLRTFAWNHAMAPDGRIVALVSSPGERTRELGVVTGFHQQLKRMAPARP